jgi:hypothetical protein
MYLGRSKNDENGEWCGYMAFDLLTYNEKLKRKTIANKDTPKNNIDENDVVPDEPFDLLLNKHYGITFNPDYTSPSQRDNIPVEDIMDYFVYPDMTRFIFGHDPANRWVAEKISKKRTFKYLDHDSCFESLNPNNEKSFRNVSNFWTLCDELYCTSHHMLSQHAKKYHPGRFQCV